MYGIILDSMTDCIRRLYGEETWKRVVGSTDISNTVFTTHKIYDEQMIPIIAKALSGITGNGINTIMEQFGRHFIAYIDDIRNDRIAKVLGRTFKDFLNGLDCMHEYYRFSFPEMQPPSFFVAEEDEEGLEVHYRTRRTFTGVMFYVKGIVHEIATSFFSLDVNIEITQHGFTGDVLCAVFRLHFRNDEYVRCRELIKAKRDFRENNKLSFPSHVFFELFPFHVVFDERLCILSSGHGLDELYPGLDGRRINETFFLTRPLGYDLTWENVLIHTNNVFELTSVKAAGRRGKTDDTSRFRHQMAATHFIKLRGQMLYVEEWNHVIFLSTLMLDDLNTMYEMGIYVNDLTFHDLSRDMVLHGPQQTTEYKLALDLEQGQTARLEEIIETLDAERRKTDVLLHSMIPKEIARSLKQGCTTMTLCERHDEVTILFSDIVNFESIYMHIAPHEIMIILNMMVSVFDILCEKFGIYKVETVADGFMAVSGAPTYDEHHARNMADMAFEMLNGIKTVKDPNTRASIHIRIGLHCGYVVSGLVGIKIPRYCLFGDTVNIASKMEATGEGQRIQISQTCKDSLSRYGNTYIIEDKGMVQAKGCGNIMTYWLTGVNSDSKLLNLDTKRPIEFKNIRMDTAPFNEEVQKKTSVDAKVEKTEEKKPNESTVTQASTNKLMPAMSPNVRSTREEVKDKKERNPISAVSTALIDTTVNTKKSSKSREKEKKKPSLPTIASQSKKTESAQGTKKTPEVKKPIVSKSTAEKISSSGVTAKEEGKAVKRGKPANDKPVADRKSKKEKHADAYKTLLKVIRHYGVKNDMDDMPDESLSLGDRALLAEKDILGTVRVDMEDSIKRGDTNGMGMDRMVENLRQKHVKNPLPRSIENLLQLPNMVVPGSPQIEAAVVPRIVVSDSNSLPIPTPKKIPSNRISSPKGYNFQQKETTEPITLRKFGNGSKHAYKNKVIPASTVTTPSHKARSCQENAEDSLIITESIYGSTSSLASRSSGYYSTSRVPPKCPFQTAYERKRQNDGDNFNLLRKSQIDSKVCSIL
ncbi:soluble guanylate cyclase gcy-31-like [Styela clava]